MGSTPFLSAQIFRFDDKLHMEGARQEETQKMQQNDLGPKNGETSEQFKERIAETQREIKRQQADASKATAASANVPTAPAPIPNAPEQVPAPTAKVEPSTSKTEPAKTPFSIGSPEVDEWLGKKGFKSPEDFANSYRELERELTRKRQEEKSQGNPPVAPAQGYPVYAPPAPPPYGYPPVPPPAYVPPVAPPVDSEILARQYGLDKADFERIAAVANDLAEAKMNAEMNRRMGPIMQRVQRVEKEGSRQSEIVNLMADPTWKNPQVHYEMNRVLSDDPTIFEKQAQPIRYAHEQALLRIARQNLGGSNPTQDTPPTSGSHTPATRPPATAGGNGNAGSGAPTSGAVEVDRDSFAKLSLVEKRAYLQSQGVISRA